MSRVKEYKCFRDGFQGRMQDLVEGGELWSVPICRHSRAQTYGMLSGARLEFFFFQVFGPIYLNSKLE